MKTKYFRPLQGRWSVAQNCRSLIEFRQLNLTQPWPTMPACDFILLRNVLLYFDVPTRMAVLERMRRTLRPDGALFLGGAETMLGMDIGYERKIGTGCSYYIPLKR
jgi:chemotaxis protein methyltransferase CheR